MTKKTLCQTWLVLCTLLLVSAYSFVGAGFKASAEESVGPDGGQPEESTDELTTMALELKVVDQAMQPIAGAQVRTDIGGLSGVTDVDGFWKPVIVGKAYSDLRVFAKAVGLEERASCGLILRKLDSPFEIVLMLYKGVELSGRVLKGESDEPYANAKVDVRYEFYRTYEPIPEEEGRFRFRTTYLWNAGFEAHNEGFTLRTGPDGRFSARGLPSGAFTIHAQSSLLIDNDQPNEFDLGSLLNGTIDPSFAEVVLIDEEENEDITLRVTDYPSVSFTLSGSQPDFVYIDLMVEDESPWSVGLRRYAYHWRMQKLTPDATGRFIFSGVVPEHVSLSLKSVDSKTLMVRLPELRKGDTDLGELFLEPGFSIYGRVVDATGKGVSGVPVTLGSEAVSKIFQTQESTNRPDLAISGSDGAFTLKGLDPGRVYLWADSKDFVCEGVVAEASDIPVGDIELKLVAPGEVYGSVKLLSAGLDGLPEGFPIPEGHDKPIDHATIELVPMAPQEVIDSGLDREKWIDYAWNWREHHRVEVYRGQPEYHFNRVQPGRYFLHGSFGKQRISIGLLDVQAGEKLRHDFPFEAISIVYGIATDAEGKPMANARLSLLDHAKSSYRTQSDAEGRFVFVNAPKGKATLLLSKEKFVNGLRENYRRSVWVDEGKCIRKDLKLEAPQGSVLNGKATLGEGGRFKQVGLWRRGTTPPDFHLCQIGDGGTFRVEGLMPGEYIMYLIGGRPGLLARETLTIAGGDTNTFEKEYAYHPLRCKVTYAGKTPEYPAEVSLRPDLGPVEGLEWIDKVVRIEDRRVGEDGTIEFPAVIAGNHILMVKSWDHARVHQSVSVTAAIEVSVEVSEPASSVRLAIDEIHGVPLDQEWNKHRIADFPLLDGDGKVIYHNAIGSGGPARLEAGKSSNSHTGLVAGKYGIRLQGWLIEPWSTTFELGKEEERTIHASLQKAAWIRLRVANSDFTIDDLCRANMHVVNAQSGEAAPTRSAFEGFPLYDPVAVFAGFEQGGLTAGTWKVTITVPGYKPFVQSYTVERGKELNEEIVLVK